MEGPSPAPEPEPTPPGRLHAAAISGMAVCALAGILSMFVFITVRWPGATGRYVIAVLAGSVIGFMACASIAVFSAARDTYPHHRGRGVDPPKN